MIEPYFKLNKIQKNIRKIDHRKNGSIGTIVLYHRI